MRSRRRQAPIIDLESDRREAVCLRVAAEFVGVDERTLRARIEAGQLDAWRDGKVYRIGLPALRRYLVDREAHA
jgi:excisionase family DNA binding protein